VNFCVVKDQQIVFISRLEMPKKSWNSLSAQQPGKDIDVFADIAASLLSAGSKADMFEATSLNGVQLTTRL